MENVPKDLLKMINLSLEDDKLRKKYVGLLKDIVRKNCSYEQTTQDALQFMSLIS